MKYIGSPASPRRHKTVPASTDLRESCAGVSCAEVLFQTGRCKMVCGAHSVWCRWQPWFQED
eukprot:3780218-Rhodomonas_salina.1